MRVVVRQSLKIALCALPALLYVAHASLYGSWIIDDAAISCAYAQNLAAGHGLVAQPGALPVEGYSNPLWVFLLAACARVGALDPVWTTKLLGGGFSLLALAVLLRTFGRGERLPVAVLALSCAVLDPALAIWSVSGLENGLLLFLVALLCGSLCRTLERGADLGGAIAAAVVATGIAMTRPDGVLWFGAWPVAVLLRRRDGRGPWPVRELASYGALCLLLFGGFLASRLAIFGALLPNTFWVKQGDSTLRIPLAVAGVPLALAALRWSGARLRERWQGARGQAARWLPAIALAAGMVLVLLATGARTLLRGCAGPSHLLWGAAFAALWGLVRAPAPATRAAVLGAAFGAMAYLALARDRASEFRFATAFVPLFLLAFFGLCDAAIDELRAARRRWWPVLGVAAAALLLPSYGSRMLRFRDHPTWPLAECAAQHAVFERYRAVLGGGPYSLLTEDIGAPLLFSSFRIDDLGGLIDPGVARTLYRDPAGVCARVFGELRPDFLRLYDYIARNSGLADDRRFRGDYAPIHEELVPRGSDGTGPLVPIGHYVRRELLADAAQLEALRAVR